MRPVQQCLVSVAASEKRPREGHIPNSLAGFPRRALVFPPQPASLEAFMRRTRHVLNNTAASWAHRRATYVLSHCMCMQNWDTESEPSIWRSSTGLTRELARLPLQKEYQKAVVYGYRQGAGSAHPACHLQREPAAPPGKARSPDDRITPPSLKLPYLRRGVRPKNMKIEYSKTRIRTKKKMRTG